MVNRKRRNAPRILPLLLIASVLGAIAWQACGGGGESPPATETPDPIPTATSAPQALFPDLEGLLATKDLGVGTSRVAFVLQTSEGLVTLPQLKVSSAFLPVDGSGSVAGETVSARFRLWPFGTRGNYVTEMSFDKPGSWQIEAIISQGESVLASAVMPVEVKEQSFTPAVGSEPPLTVNKTEADVEDFGELTAWPRPDPDLYQLTIPEALVDELPLVLVMSSPGFCTSPTCGPQVDTVTDLKDIYAGQANFIHVEVYDNPKDIQVDLTQGRYSPVVEAWGLTKLKGYLNESWVFIIDSSGKISSKYEGYASLGELEDGVKKVL